MDNNNPAEMSNQDLENDMLGSPVQSEKGNQEGVNKSSAAEGTLKTPESDEGSKANVIGAHRTGGGEKDLDELVHSTGETEDSQDGSMPDPESLDTWESNDDDTNKISS